MLVLTGWNKALALHSTPYFISYHTKHFVSRSNIRSRRHSRNVWISKPVRWTNFKPVISHDFNKLAISVWLTEGHSDCEAEMAIAVIAIELKEKRTMKENWTEGEEQKSFKQNRYFLSQERNGRKEVPQRLNERGNFAQWVIWLTFTPETMIKYKSERNSW